MEKLILASASPRRREILEMAGYHFEVLKTDSEEISEGLCPSELVEKNALLKAEAALKVSSGIMICADTVVEIDGKILGKPTSPDDARRMLEMLSGRDHTVLSGYAVTDGKKTVSGCETVTVHMRKITEREIGMYVDSGIPLDKAGAYGIQSPAGMFVSGIEGDYYTVMGLPLCRISEILREEFGTEPDIR